MIPILPEGFPGEDDGWHATLPGIAYAGGMVKAIFHAADGQDFSDNSITFSTGGPPLTIPDDATLWDGISVPDAGTSRATNGGLWDIHTFDITAAFGPPGSTTLQLDGQDNVSDCLGLVLMLLDLEPGSAPPPTPTPSPSPSATLQLQPQLQLQLLLQLLLLLQLQLLQHNTYSDSIGCLPTVARLLEKSSQCLASEYSDAGQPDIYQDGIAKHIEQSGWR